MPLQLISILIYFIFLLLPPVLSTGLIGKSRCPVQCGNLSIPYPFGVGSNCSLDQSFTISCNSSSTDPPKAYLSIIDTEVIELNETYIRVKYPNLVSVCYDLSNYEHGKGMNVTTDSYKHVNFSGTPYTLSYMNKLTAIGCDDVVLQSNGSSTRGGCSAFCADKNDTGGVGYCPNNGSSHGNGCCQTYISSDTAGFVGAQLIDWSKKLVRRKLFPCSYAFIQEEAFVNSTVFSYPLYYLDNSTALVNDNWASTTRPPVVRLDWMINTAENCSQAQLNLNSFACQDDQKSVCVDVDGDNYPYLPVGYRCSCLQGYEGNAYLPGGCKPISFSSSITKHGCPDQCGKLSIPFPFGVGPKCSLVPSFEIICNTSTNPPKPYLSVLNAEIIRLMNSSQVRVNYPNLGLACYNWSDYRPKITKTVERTLIIDLSRTQYTLSNNNWITTIGCDDMVVGIIGQANRSFLGSSCAAICQDSQITLDDYGQCPSGSTAYQPGDGCCRAPIPRGTTYLEANLTDFSGRWPRTNFSCSYAFVGYKDAYYQYPYPILNNSTEITPEELLSSGYWELQMQTILALDWRIGAENCNKAKQNLITYACQNNSDCVDFDATVGGYLCNCSQGYQGNPYLPDGCQEQILTNVVIIQLIHAIQSQIASILPGLFTARV